MSDFSDWRLRAFRKRKRKQRLSVNGYTKISYGRSVATGYGETIEYCEDRELWAELLEIYPLEVAKKVYGLEIENRQLRNELAQKDWQLYEARQLNSDFFEATVHLNVRNLVGGGVACLRAQTNLTFGSWSPFKSF